jgi:hypothetical protein
MVYSWWVRRKLMVRLLDSGYMSLWAGPEASREFFMGWAGGQPTGRRPILPGGLSYFFIFWAGPEHQIL